MALVRCPECGREKVSDSAERCPECGYSVKEHFDREMRKELLRKQQSQAKERRKQEENKLKSELDMKLKEIDGLRPAPEPEEPTIFRHMFYYNNSLSMFSWVLIGVVVLFLLSFVSSIFVLLFAILLVLGVPFAGYITYLDWKMARENYKNKYEEWKMQQNNWDEYIEKRKASIRKEYESITVNMANYGSRQMPISKSQTVHEQLKCPICGATNVERISTVNRGVSIAMVGLASGKIGKQYKCKKCKHMW